MGLMAVVTSASGNHTPCELGGAGSAPSPCICFHAAKLWLLTTLPRYCAAAPCQAHYNR